MNKNEGYLLLTFTSYAFPFGELMVRYENEVTPKKVRQDGHKRLQYIVCNVSMF